MKHFFLLSAFFMMSFVSIAQQDIQTDVVYLSSNYLEGRDTGSKGEELAAQYIAHRFKEEGLSPKGENGWFQEFSYKHKAHPHDDKGTKRSGKNVIGFLNNKAKTTIVFIAHYDHLGMGGSGSRNLGEADIHNGADDNASGVAGLFAIASKLYKNKAAKKNNYLFIACSAEEAGLIGSKYFVNNPTVALEKINYAINMDMIGRLKADNSLVVNGFGTSPQWEKAFDRTPSDLDVTTSLSGVGPSDHTSFYFKDIPALHFFTGVHEQYHKPSDDAHLVNFKGIDIISGFIVDVVKTLNKSGKIQFSKTKEETAGRTAASFKVSLGVLPDYAYEGEGMKIEGVLEDKPAQRAGLQGGDIILKIGDVDVKNIYDYMEGLGKLEAGSKSKVVVQRGDQELSLDVQF